MFISFLEPFPVRNVKAPHLWVFYKQLNELSEEDIIFIGSKDYFLDPEFYKNKRKDIGIQSQIKNKYVIPTKEIIDNYQKFIIDDEVFNLLKQKYISNIDIWKYLLTNVYYPLEEELIKIFSQLDLSKIDGILSWTNSPTLAKVAKKFNLKIIYNELGPLRYPLYHQNAYFSLDSLHIDNTIESRFLQFLEEASYNELLDVEDIKIMMLKDMEILNLEKIDELYVGVALQVEDDSNIIAYSNGIDAVKLLHYVKEREDNILIRKHPLSFFDVSNKFGKKDISKNSIEFLNKISKLYTINSSLAFEGYLFDKSVEILGKSVYYLFEKFKDKKKELLNFFVFNYFIPYDLLYDKKYYLWRLNNPSEKEIFYNNLNYYKFINGIKGENFCISNDKILKYFNKKISKMEEAIKEKNEKISKMEEAIKEKNEKISKMEEAIKEKNEKISKMEEAIKEKNEKISKMEEAIKEKNEKISKVEEAIKEKNDEILMYVTSKSWKITRPLRKIKKVLK